jgi:hypothetical protein
MKNLVLKTVLIGLATLFAFEAQSQCFQDEDGKFYNIDGTPCTNTVVTAVPFLRIVADARSGAMGDVGIGLSPDANAMHFNPSKLVFAEEELGLSATYTPWLRSLGLNDVYLAYLSGYYKIDEFQAIGGSIRYFSLGSITFTDENGQILTTGRPNEFEIATSYARKLTDRFSASVGAKFIFSNLAAGQEVQGETIEEGLAGAADISFTYNTPVDLGETESNLIIGLALTNIGSKITYTNSINRDFLPANIGLGAGWEFFLDEYNTITFALDINKLMVPTPCQGTDCDQDGDGRQDYKDQSSISGVYSLLSMMHRKDSSEELQELMYSTGMEYWYDKQFAVRAGYYLENAKKGNRQFFTVGLGLKYNIFGLNFSYLDSYHQPKEPIGQHLAVLLAV